MNTGLYYLSKVPYKVQVQILKNITEYSMRTGRDWTISKDLQKLYRSYRSFIHTTFVWSDTPEGTTYWQENVIKYSTL
jgi:hypothetical protein